MRTHSKSEQFVKSVSELEKSVSELQKETENHREMLEKIDSLLSENEEFFLRSKALLAEIKISTSQEKTVTCSSLVAPQVASLEKCTAHHHALIKTTKQLPPAVYVRRFWVLVSAPFLKIRNKK